MYAHKITSYVIFMCLLIHYTIFKNRMQEKQKARQSLAKYLLQRNINQRKALYIIRNLLRYIIKTKFCISSLRKLFDTRYAWWDTTTALPLLMIYSLTADDMPLLSQWIKKELSFRLVLFWWERVDSNHRRRCQQIYSLPPLATREHSHVHYSKKWSWWTDSNPRPADYKSAALPTELHQRLNAWLLYHKRFRLSIEFFIFLKTFLE